MANETIPEVLQAVLDALRAGERVALLTVVRSVGSTPRHSGARLLVREDGSTLGTIGGGTMEERAVAEALEALREGKSRLSHYDFGGKHEGSVGLCGGSAEVFIEVLEPEPRLILIGAGHIAQPLATMARLAGMAVIVVDDRPEYANQERFPMAQEIHVVRYDRQSEHLDPLPVRITPTSSVVLATWGWDEPALRQVLPARPRYIGLVASRRKAKIIFDDLLAEGFSPGDLEQVRVPAGLDLGAETPGEIAVSILAEILMVRSQATGRPLKEVRGPVPLTVAKGTS